MTDVRESSATGSDYVPNMKVLVRLRITDISNGASQSEPATVIDTNFAAPVTCEYTSDSAIGSMCHAETSANAVLPGFVKQDASTLWQVMRVRVFDSGADGVLHTSDDPLFAQQGVFVP